MEQKEIKSTITRWFKRNKFYVCVLSWLLFLVLVGAVPWFAILNLLVCIFICVRHFLKGE